MKNIGTTHKLVEGILKDNIDARNSDDALYLRVCGAINPIATNMSIRDLFMHRAALGIPSYESVSRARRKLQAGNEEYKASQRVLVERSINEELAVEYAKQQI